jgi:hypothetical protein
LFLLILLCCGPVAPMVIALQKLMTISISARLRVPEEVLVSEVGSEAVLLDLRSERYFSLDETGAAVWRAVAATPSVQTAYDALLAEYEVEPERLRQDMFALLEKLAEHGLVEVASD